MESLQAMEYLTEFPTLEERRDFKHFPPMYEDPHYHPSQLKKHDDGRSRRRPGEERTSIFGSSSDREPRRNALGQGGFMSPMRQLAEAVHRVPSVQDINVEGTMENLPDTPINDQWDDSIDVTPDMGDNIPSTMEQPLNERENTIRDLEVVAEHVSLLNGGPSTSQQDTVTPTTTTGTMTSTTAPTGPISMEAVSISSTPPVISTDMEERIPLNYPICLTEEDPQIRCTVCNTIDCMVHNPRHRYCMDCGQRLLGPHTCSNQIEHVDPTRTQDSAMTDRILPTEPENYNPEILLPRHYEPNVGALEDRVLGNNPLINRDPIPRQPSSSSVAFETLHNELPTYEEAVTPDPDLPTRTRLVPNM